MARDDDVQRWSSRHDAIIAREEAKHEKAKADRERMEKDTKKALKAAMEDPDTKKNLAEQGVELVRRRGNPLDGIDMYGQGVFGDADKISLDELTKRLWERE